VAKVSARKLSPVLQALTSAHDACALHAARLSRGCRRPCHAGRFDNPGGLCAVGDPYRTTRRWPRIKCLTTRGDDRQRVDAQHREASKPGASVRRAASVRRDASRHHRPCRSAHATKSARLTARQCTLMHDFTMRQLRWSNKRLSRSIASSRIRAFLIVVGLGRDTATFVRDRGRRSYGPRAHA
jgi:hypothetical protein